MFKAYIGDSLSKNLSRIISPELIMQMNYAGCRQKEGFSTFAALNAVMYESQKREGYRHEDFIKDIRAAFTRQKNRVYKDASKRKATTSKDKGPDKDNDLDIDIEDEEIE
ncbi:uncharacterized protein [Drosophila takahashii]|uniref:uncharacterized protein n=1 Tax=Drosophila takahashii TaxID=29030 RepID=UPI001CF8EBD5|nr:uncharacterized protein LOC123002797 [Drosophila takahashii]